MNFYNHFRGVTIFAVGLSGLVLLITSVWVRDQVRDTTDYQVIHVNKLPAGALTEAGLPESCIADVNVTLGDDCSLTITPEMVLTEPYLGSGTFNIAIDETDSDMVQGCGMHTYTIELIENEEVVYTCWGNILAEDKTDPVLVCPEDTDGATLEEAVSYFGGALEVTDDQLELANYSCFQEFFSPVAGLHYYDLYTFSPEANDVYTFVGELIGPDFNANISLFAGAFDPTSPCQNIIAHSEALDYAPLGGLLAPGLRLTLPLIANETYTLMVSSRTPAGATGAYRIYSYADGNGEIAGLPFEETNVPLQLQLPLICSDIYEVGFTEPKHWIVAADGTLDYNATANTFFGSDTDSLDAFLAQLSYTGIPITTDNCGPVLVSLSDEVSESGDCGDWTISRTFTVADRYDGSCLGDARTVECVQTITIRKPGLDDLFLPPFTATIECDETYPTDGELGGIDENPHPSLTGYPFIMTTFGYHDLAQNQCSLGASYSDEPRINICEGTFSYRREWNIVDWCNPDDNLIYDQYVRVGDFTGPDISGVPQTITLSTSPFNCEANFPIPTPTIVDGNSCGSATATTYTVLANGEEFFIGGLVADEDIVQLPVGEHQLVICAADDCGNESCETYELLVSDEIEPSAACDDELIVAIGGGDIAGGTSGVARIFAEDVDEGSQDNCGLLNLEVRRNFWRDASCDPSENRWSRWGDHIDFYCCDIANEITVELRISDASDNINTCWLTVTPEDKINPYCYAPEDVELDCAQLPLTFPGDIEQAYEEDFGGTSIMMSALFGNATGTDNCAVDTIVERSPNININACGWGSITRRFEVWQLKPEGDINGNGAIDINEVDRSTNSCSQTILITELHDFAIAFPWDASANCGDPEVPEIQTETTGCDALSINTGEPVRFEATGDECYKYAITYDVINWCLWDGEYAGYNVPRYTEDDGEALLIDRAVEANERPVIIYTDENGLVIDRDHERPTNEPDYGEEAGRWFVSNGGDSSIPDNVEFGTAAPDLPNYGRYIYTQFVKVYDTTAPSLAIGEFGGPTDDCPQLLPGQFGDTNGDCEALVSIPFSVSDDCELFDADGNLVVQVVSAELDAFAVDANEDGQIWANEFVSDQSVLDLVTDNGDGTFHIEGDFPVITAAMGDHLIHAVRVLIEDGCGNQTSQTILFHVVDCKAPAPVCINGLTVTLMPQEDGECVMTILASDFEGSPIYDCTGQGAEVNELGQNRVTSYAIYRAITVEDDPDFEPNPDDSELVLTQDDEESTVIFIYAFDEEGNYAFCETYVLVQGNSNCELQSTGTISGIIRTEEDSAVEGVAVSLSGNESTTLSTTADGSYEFTQLVTGADYSITPYLDTNPLNGVTTFDLIKIAQHILGTEALNSPYKMIAADANRSGSITTLDMIQIRKLILNIITDFPNNTSWRFVAADYEFADINDPWATEFPEVINVNNLPAASELFANFVGVKTGDVNGSAVPNVLAGNARNLTHTQGVEPFYLQVQDMSLQAGNTYTLAVSGEDLEQIAGLQGTMQLDGAELVDIEYGLAEAANFGWRYAEQGFLTMSWNWPDASYFESGPSGYRNRKDDASSVLFSLVIRATADRMLSEVLQISDRYTKSAAYAAKASASTDEEELGLEIHFTDVAQAGPGFELYQNSPNPFRDRSLIGFQIPQESEVLLTIHDAGGRLLQVIKGEYSAGYHSVMVSKSMLRGASGLISYTLQVRPKWSDTNARGDRAELTATRQMIVVE